MPVLQIVNIFYNIDRILKDDGLTLIVKNSPFELRVAMLKMRRVRGDKAVLGYGFSKNIKSAIYNAGLHYMAGSPPIEMIDITGPLKSDDSIDDWVLNGKLLFAASADGKIILEARDRQGRIMECVTSKNFFDAYPTLNKLLEQTYRKFYA